MGYEVIITDKVHEQIDAQLAWLSLYTVQHVRPWLRGLLKRVEELEAFPKRYRRMPEYDMMGEQVRGVIYGDYILVYVIDEKAKRVTILRLIHGAQNEDMEHNH